ncbi:BrxA/BrxB family bacilliredoxin [Bacillus sp. FJAT-49732]|uniref:BrxA/BrxB family bacilliredoxin n=1 Tax=Lederbergia citrisecunda TaxID=2833583 RepID=A0A942TJW8_9BACI|nr:BrxA/BrxB family bacilliredoxin [Lederbergia citrisecunda]MBS4199440.1 BrxA/BrxB family bacilliredoxin [Lederbergia citrisecunda]
MSMAYEEYMKQIVKPMREELTNANFQELRTEEAVEDFMENVTGTTLVVINSVCGCAAGLARPAAIHSVSLSENKPDHLVTVFAGQDREATEKMRSFINGQEPSSPSMALFKGKDLVHFIPREDIEDNDVDTIVKHLIDAFSKNFS